MQQVLVRKNVQKTTFEAAEIFSVHRTNNASKLQLMSYYGFVNFYHIQTNFTEWQTIDDSHGSTTYSFCSFWCFFWIRMGDMLWHNISKKFQTRYIFHSHSWHKKDVIASLSLMFYYVWNAFPIFHIHKVTLRFIVWEMIAWQPIFSWHICCPMVYVTLVFLGHVMYILLIINIVESKLSTRVNPCGHYFLMRGLF